MKRLLVTLVAAVVVGAPGCRASGPAPGSSAAGTSRAGAPRAARGSSPDAGLSPAARAARRARLAQKSIEIGWVGDITLGSMYGEPPDLGRPLFANLKAELRRPDLMIGNLEGTLSRGGVSKCTGKDPKTCWAFQAPPENAAALSGAGFDFVNLANNHIRDYGDTGENQTLAALSKRHVRWIGVYDDPPSIVVVRGVRVALIGFSPYGWSPRLTDISSSEQLIGEAARAADVVVVVMHAGAEGQAQTHTPPGAELAYREDRGRTRDFAHAAVDAGAAVVLGSGPHVLRGIERYRGHLIAYSLGNFAGWDNFSTAGVSRLSGLLTVRLDGVGRFRGGRLIPLALERPGIPRVDPASGALDLVRRVSREDFPHSFELDARGTIKS